MGLIAPTGVEYETYIPSDPLKPFIRSFAIQEVAAEATYKILPDTGIVIGFQYKGRLFRVGDGGSFALDTSGISGLADHHRSFRNLPGTGTILVFFKEAGAAPFFRQPLHEIFRESVTLENFMLRSELLCLEEQLIEAPTNPERIIRLEKFFIGRMTQGEPDKLVLAALALIHKSRGSIRIKDLVQQLHTSPSPLEKRFPLTPGHANRVRTFSVFDSLMVDLGWRFAFGGTFFGRSSILRSVFVTGHFYPGVR